MTFRKPILVTGSHRSGSTWVGHIIANAPKVKLVYEPFNLNTAGQRQLPFRYWNEYVSYNTKHSHQEVKRKIKGLYGFKRSQLNYPYDTLSLENLRLYFYRIWASLTYRPLLKDPIAIFSAPWIYEEFKSDVVVIIRHPAAFVASLKVAHWPFDFSHFLEQKELLNDYLGDYREEIKSFSESPRSIVEQGCLLWNIMYSTVAKFQTTYANQWYFVTHEQLSLEPKLEFTALLDYLGLTYTKRVQEKIRTTTNSKEVDEHHRNSQENIKTWKKRLSSEEIRYIKAKTSNVWPHFYGEPDWE